MQRTPGASSVGCAFLLDESYIDALLPCGEDRPPNIDHQLSPFALGSQGLVVDDCLQVFLLRCLNGCIDLDVHFLQLDAAFTLSPKRHRLGHIDHVFGPQHVGFEMGVVQIRLSQKGQRRLDLLFAHDAHQNLNASSLSKPGSPSSEPGSLGAGPEVLFPSVGACACPRFFKACSAAAVHACMSVGSLACPAVSAQPTTLLINRSAESSHAALASRDGKEEPAAAPL